MKSSVCLFAIFCVILCQVSVNQAEHFWSRRRCHRHVRERPDDPLPPECKGKVAFLVDGYQGQPRGSHIPRNHHPSSSSRKRNVKRTVDLVALSKVSRAQPNCCPDSKYERDECTDATFIDSRCSCCPPNTASCHAKGFDPKIKCRPNTPCCTYSIWKLKYLCKEVRLDPTKLCPCCPDPDSMWQNCILVNLDANCPPTPAVTTTTTTTTTTSTTTTTPSTTTTTPSTTTTTPSTTTTTTTKKPPPPPKPSKGSRPQPNCCPMSSGEFDENGQKFSCKDSSFENRRCSCCPPDENSCVENGFDPATKCDPDSECCSDEFFWGDPNNCHAIEGTDLTKLCPCCPSDMNETDCKSAGYDLCSVTPSPTTMTTTTTPTTTTTMPSTTTPSTTTTTPSTTITTTTPSTTTTTPSTTITTTTPSTTTTTPSTTITTTTPSTTTTTPSTTTTTPSTPTTTPLPTNSTTTKPPPIEVFKIPIEYSFRICELPPDPTKFPPPSPPPPPRGRSNRARSKSRSRSRAQSKRRSLKWELERRREKDEDYEYYDYYYDDDEYYEDDEQVETEDSSDPDADLDPLYEDEEPGEEPEEEPEEYQEPEVTIKKKRRRRMKRSSTSSAQVTTLRKCEPVSVPEEGNPWWDNVTTSLITNDWHIIAKQCNSYFRASQHFVIGPSPDPTSGRSKSKTRSRSKKSKKQKFIHERCYTPFAGLIKTPSGQTESFFDQGFLHMDRPLCELPLKQRRTEGQTEPELVTVKVEDYSVDGECKFCNYTDEKSRQHWQWTGRILPFAARGEFCTFENEAYLHGQAMLMVAEHHTEIMPSAREPWGKLHRFWPHLINLHMAELDKAIYEKDDGGTETKKACVQFKADSGDAQAYANALAYGDCIFNQRLATDWTHTTTKEVTFSRVGGKETVNVTIPAVGLGCAPHQLLFCNQEYNADQGMEAQCICHPLYSYEFLALTPEELEDRGLTPENRTKFPCLPMGGVPCRFNVTGDIGGLLPEEIPCAPDLYCEAIPAVFGFRDKVKLFQRTFHGFGMTPVGRDYMIQRATGICQCVNPEENFMTPFNECQSIFIKPNSGASLKISVISVLFAHLLIF